MPICRSAYSAHTADEALINSGDFTGMLAVEGGRRITAALEKEGRGKSAVTYRLRDWLVSRQRAWGTPIPVVYCQNTPSDADRAHADRPAAGAAA